MQQSGTYTAPTGKPQLTKPVPGADPTSLNTLYMLQSFPDQILQASGNLPTSPDDKFPDDMETELNNVSEEQLAKIGGWRS